MENFVNKLLNSTLKFLANTVLFGLLSLSVSNYMMTGSFTPDFKQITRIKDTLDKLRQVQKQTQNIDFSKIDLSSLQTTDGKTEFSKIDSGKPEVLPKDPQLKDVEEVIQLHDNAKKLSDSIVGPAPSAKADMPATGNDQSGMQISISRNPAQEGAAAPTKTLSLNLNSANEANNDTSKANQLAAQNIQLEKRIKSLEGEVESLSLKIRGLSAIVMGMSEKLNKSGGK